jgi:hypothetical protein
VQFFSVTDYPASLVRAVCALPPTGAPLQARIVLLFLPACLPAPKVCARVGVWLADLRASYLAALLKASTD